MRTATRHLATAAALFAATAQATPPSGRADPRVRTVSYDAAGVVPLTGHYGYQMMIALAADERIQNISIGDSVAWLVTPAKGATAVFIKPLEANAATNMTVLTDRRTYMFELSAARATRGGRTPGMIYKLQFRYPEDAARRAPAQAARQAQAVRPVVANRDYALSGSRAIRPTAVFDDGHLTYFAFPPHSEIPAIFAVEHGREALVNHATRGGYVVVDRIAHRFSLRQGEARAKIKNKGYGKPLPPAAGARVAGQPGRPR